MSDRIIVIGLCGRSGCGKGYVGSIFRNYGIFSVDTDKVYRELLDEDGSECLCELTDFFGEEILTREKKLDRRRLASIVFAKGNEDKLQKLNGITHKYILKKTKELISEYESDGKRAIIIDAPVLFESGFDSLCDITLCVTAPDTVLIKRICERDGRTEEEARLRLASQKSEDELRRRCSDVIVNDGVRDTAVQVADFIDKYKLGENYEI